MPKYEFLIIGDETTKYDMNLSSDDEAMDFAVELQIAEPNKKVDWKRIYEQKEER